MKLLLAVLLLACGSDDEPARPRPEPAPPVLPGPPWVELHLPAAIGGWTVSPARDEGPEQGYHVDYLHESNGVSVSVFVYGNAQRNSTALSAELRNAMDGVRQAIAAGRYESARELDVGMAQLGSSRALTFVQRLAITEV